MGKCSVCGKKGLLMKTHNCVSCGKEICENCSGTPFFLVEASSDPKFSVLAFLSFERNYYACSDNCRNSFKDVMLNRDFHKIAGTTLDSKRVKSTFCDVFISEKQPHLYNEIRESSGFPSIYRIHVRMFKGNPFFDSIYASFEREFNLGLASNLEQAGLYLDAANVFENRLQDYANARKMRDREKVGETRQPADSIDLPAMLKQFQTGDLVAVYRCPHCGGKLKISKDTTAKSLKNCVNCNLEIEAAEMADFLRTALS